MRSAMKLAALGLAALFLSGCVVRSIFPFYGSETVAATKAVPSGKWKVVQAPTRNWEKYTPWVVADDRLTTYDEDGKSGVLKMTFFNVGQTLFVDLFPEEGNVSNSFAGVVLVPTHTLCKVTSIQVNGKTQVTFTPLSFKYLKEGLESGTINLPVVKQKDDEYLFTATTEQWQAFLNDARNSQAVFDPEQRFDFTVEPTAK